MPSRQTVVVAGPIDEVWAVLADLALIPEWQSGTRRIEFVSDARRGVGVQWKQFDTFGPLSFTHLVEVVEEDAPHLQRIESVTGSRLESVRRLMRIDDRTTRLEIQLTYDAGPEMRAAGDEARMARRSAETFKRIAEKRIALKVAGAASASPADETAR